PLSQPMDLGKYFGPFVLLGGYWITFIIVSFTCGAVYLICFVIAAQQGTFIKFKDFIKWW
ncbi:hypothetical protein, partial [Staphylococcus aureus]|uniref:hypothetical protein n=2 Tax=Bacillales TaxID=1385 RepID=UPI0019627AB4